MGTEYNSTADGFTIKFLVDGSHGEVAKILESTWDSIRIVNRIQNHSPIVYIDFDIDNEAFIKYNMYPQCNFQMEISYSDGDPKIYGEPVKLDLLILEMSVPLPQKYKYNISDRHEVYHRHTLMTCVPKRCHEILNATVNKMWWDPIKVWDAVTEVVNELKITPRKMDEPKANKKILDQLLVPPMSFQNFLLYMDEKYGIYDGKLFFYMHYTGTFYMWELKYKFDTEKPGVYNVYKMPTYTKQEESDYTIPAKLAKKTPNNYITAEEMKTICITNDPFINDGVQQYHIFHPQEDISRIVIWDAASKAESDGIHSGKIDLKVNNTPIRKRVTVRDGNIGDEKERTHQISIKANYIDPAYKMNFLHFKLDRKFNPFYVMKIGEPMNLIVFAENEKYSPSDYSGSYLLLESEFLLSRDQGQNNGNDTVLPECNIKCCRTSQSHS